MTTRTHPLAFYRDTLGLEVRNDVGYGGMRSSVDDEARVPAAPEAVRGRGGRA